MIPAKADPVEQTRFFDDHLLPRLDEARAGQREVWFVDAAHFLYGPFLGFLWCATRQFVPGPSGRKRYNVLSALNPLTFEVVSVCSHTSINWICAGRLLRRMWERGSGVPMTLVLDNAPYFKKKWVGVIASYFGIELLFLPTYSPNLNLIERLWRFVRKESLSTKTFATYAEFTAAIDDCLAHTTTTHRQALATLLNLKFQFFRDVSVLTA